MDNTFLVDIDYLETEHGIFTSNKYLGLNAQEVYDKWLYDKENPQPQPPTLEEVVKEQQCNISILEKENEQLKQINSEQDNLLVDSAYKIALLELTTGLGGM